MLIKALKVIRLIVGIGFLIIMAVIGIIFSASFSIPVILSLNFSNI